jgi:hypothetical protein
MKKTLLNLVLAITLLYSGKISAQSCSATILGDEFVCVGTQSTLNAQVFGPGQTLNASNTAGNNHRGNMFDITATNTVSILSFDASPMGNTTIEIYYKVGTWNGFANTPSAWTYIGSAPVTYTGGFVPVAVPVNITIPAGQTYAFYVTSNTTAVSLNYSNGTAVGNVYSADANITFHEGGGMEYQNTGAVYQPRVWNGAIHYALPDASTTYTWSTGETTQSIQTTINTSTQVTLESTIPGCPTLYDTLDIVTSIPLVSAGNDITACNGDSILLHATGNAASYSWNNGIMDSVAFAATSSLQYITTATDSIGCTNADTLMVNVNALPPVFAGADFNICMYENVTLSGQGAVSYSWNNGVQDNVPFEALASMQYVVTGTDVNNCVQTDTVQVTVNPLPNVYGGGDQEACYGMEFTLSGSGADSYAWTNGVIDGVPYIVPMGVNEYIVTGTDLNGCSNMDTVQITALNNQALIANIGTTLITSMEIGYAIQWYNCDDQQVIAGETGFTYTPTVTGNYAAIVTNDNQCTDTSDCIFIDFTGVEENTINAFEVSPNPTFNTITIQSANTTIDKVEVLNVVGQVVYETISGKMKTTIDLSAFEGTQFFVRIVNNDKIQVVKVLKY